MIYFAFGSNMDPEQMRARCPSHRVLGPAYLPGHALCFPRRSPRRRCATAGFAAAAGKGVWGVLYELGDGDLPKLHEAEGYAPGRVAALNRHDFVPVEVRRGGTEGETIRAFTYCARPDGSGAIPSRDYLDHLLRGAKHHGLPRAYVAALQSIKTD